MKRKTLWLTAAACLLALLIGLTGCSPKKLPPVPPRRSRKP